MREKKKLCTEKLSLLIQLNNSYFVGCDVSVYYSPIVLSFLLKYKENCSKRQRTDILKMCIGKLKRQEAKLKVWSVSTRY